MSEILSHDPNATSLETALTDIRIRVSASENAEQLLKIVDELATFEFGRFLMLNSGGWDGFWTWNVISRPDRDEPYSCELEKFLFLEAPTVQATRERFHLFQAAIETEIKPGMEVASLPCGLMADLLTLKPVDARFVGLDLDEKSLELAADFAVEKNLESRSEFIQADAWNLDIEDRFDVLTSNGLNIYERDDERVTELYRSFATALKPGGLLVTSFLTPPPPLAGPEGCEWIFPNIDPVALEQQRLVFAEILDATWASYRSTQTTRQQLLAAGFEQIEFNPGTTGMFPTVTARKAA